MPRPKRICIPGLPHHVIQRGNNRVPTFYHDEDYRYYLNVLRESMEDHGVVLHAYVLMSNHVHLLMTPASSNGLSLTMQALGRRYVMHVNKTYRRTGTLWEGRFKASVIDSDQYCLACYRYIELNPVRTGMVSTPADTLGPGIVLMHWVKPMICSRRTRFISVLLPHLKIPQLAIDGWWKRS